MDFLKITKIRTKVNKVIEKLDEPIYTQNFINPPRPELTQLAVGLSLLSDYSALYYKLKHYYIKEQSNENLEYQTVLAAYASGNYKEALFLAQDLLVARPHPEVYFVILKLCINKLSLPDTALYYSALGLENNKNNENLVACRAVACLYNASIAVYDDTRIKLLEEAKVLLDSCQSNGRNILFYKGLVHAQLGNLPEALVYSSEGHKITVEPHYSALVSLILTANEDFTEALSILKRSLKSNPCNILLYGIK
jgi:tetratricopeptide (TPR) repeat protein